MAETATTTIDSELLSKLAKRMAKGESGLAIAADLGLDQIVLGELLADPRLPSLIRTFIPSHDDIRSRFQVEAGRSLDTVLKIRDSELLLDKHPELVLRASQDLLDRAGHTAIRRIASVTFSLDAGRKELIQKTLAELAEATEDVAIESVDTATSDDDSITS